MRRTHNCDNGGLEDGYGTSMRPERWQFKSNICAAGGAVACSA